MGQNLGRCAPILAEGELGPILRNIAWAEAYIHTKWHLYPHSCLATIDMGRKLGAQSPFWGGELGPHLTQCCLGRGPPPYQVAYSSSHLARTDMGRKLGCMPLLGGGAGSPSKTTWRGPRPTCMPSFILIHSTVWPQYTNVTDRQDRQDKTDRQRSDGIGR